jgi:molybdate transport system substrate-binding protein
MDALQIKSSWLFRIIFGLLSVLLITGSAADAAEIKVLSALGFRDVLKDLGPKFERATGHKLAITEANMSAVVKLVQGGGTADLVIIPKQGIDDFVKDGKVAAGNVTVVALSLMGVAVRKGFPKPDISSPESLQRTLLAAKTIVYSDASKGSVDGTHFTKVLDRLGIASEIKSKTLLSSPPRTAGDFVANGEAEIGVQQIQNLISIAGIEIVGPLPGDLQYTLVFAAAIMAGAKNAESAKALVDFLRTPEAATVIKAKGMEPVTP